MSSTDHDTQRLQILTAKAGIDLLERMALVEYGVHCEITGDPGPLTASPTQRRNMALVLIDLAATFHVLANRIDPLADAAENDAEGAIRWEARRAALATAGEKPRLFALPKGAFEEALERAEAGV